MKTAVSIPDPVFKAAEELAKRLGASRSELYSRALEDFDKKHAKSSKKLDDAEVSRRINALLEEIGPEATKLDPVLDALQLETLENEDW